MRVVCDDCRFSYDEYVPDDVAGHARAHAAWRAGRDEAAARIDAALRGAAARAGEARDGPARVRAIEDAVRTAWTESWRLASFDEHHPSFTEYAAAFHDEILAATGDAWRAWRARYPYRPVAALPPGEWCWRATRG